MITNKEVTDFTLRNRIQCGHVITELKKLPDDFVDLILTSPPYWKLRKYPSGTVTIWDGDPECDHDWGDEVEVSQTGGKQSGDVEYNKNRTFKSASLFCKRCGAWRGQLGNEPVLQLYLNHLLQITKELKRVLKPTGVLFWNHGDCYGGSNSRGSSGYRAGFGNEREGVFSSGGIPSKCMALQNERLIIRMVDEQGWLASDRVIWAKKIWIQNSEAIAGPQMELLPVDGYELNKGNAMPNSYKNRCIFTYEPVYMLAKSQRYWFDSYALKVAYTGPLDRWGGDELKIKSYNGKAKYLEDPEEVSSPRARNLRKGSESLYRDRNLRPDSAGANRPNVWQINTEGLDDAHFAPMPLTLASELMKAGCPKEVCRECGKPRKRQVESLSIPTRKSYDGKFEGDEVIDKDTKRHISVSRSVGWSSCCGKGWKRAIVLDPFMGSGTTALAAQKAGADFIGIDAVQEYVDMAYRRLGVEYRNLISDGCLERTAGRKEEVLKKKDDKRGQKWLFE